MVGEVKYSLEMEAAKLEISSLETRAVLPASKAAGFVQLMGGLTILLSIFSMFRESDISVAGVIAGSILGGFTIAAGALIQYIFDVRTMMLRDAARRGIIGLVNMDTTNA